MTPEQALALFGLEPDTTWTEIRTRYRTEVRAWHPDVRGDSPRTHSMTADLNAAFTLLEPIYRRGLGPKPAPTPTPSQHAPAEPPTDPSMDEPVDLAHLDDDGLALVAPADEVFLRLHHALDRMGEVIYADPEAGYLEALVQPAGYGPGQLAVSLQGRAHATEAFFTLEALGPEDAAPIADVVRLVARMVRLGGP
jgi:hypothetical protein